MLAPTAVVHLLPAQGSSIDATALADRIDQVRRRTAWSGEVATQGALQVPVSDSFSGVARLLRRQHDAAGLVARRQALAGRPHPRQRGDRPVPRRGRHREVELRVGEGDVHAVLQRPAAERVRRAPPARWPRACCPVRTPASSRRLPSRRIAGHDSAGLRLVPADTRSTIARADIWADQESGLPTRVEVYADRRPQPVLTTEVTSLDLGAPNPKTLRFCAPRGRPDRPQPGARRGGRRQRVRAVPAAGGSRRPSPARLAGRTSAPSASTAGVPPR